VVADSSLNAGRSYQAEIVSPILHYDDIAELQEVVRAVRGAGGRCDVSTGIHYARAVVMRSPRGKSSKDSPTSAKNCA
jgi:hypothetical protein